MRLLTACAVIALSVGIKACDYNDGYTHCSREESNYGRNRTIRGVRISSPEECARTCKQGERPKTCYYHFIVEFYSTLSRACNLCRSNLTTRLIDDCQCVEGDGYEKSGLITTNRMYPGPAIIACKDDYIIVDVDNRLPGNAITIHWHGIWQNGYQYADGIPYVTQCPILEDSTFRYQWRAKNAGTHFWHAHSGLHKGDGLEGSLIIREPKATEVNSHLWDFDKIDHVIFITDWIHGTSLDHFPGNLVRKRRQWPDNFLINGKGQWTDPTFGNTTTTPLAVFTVKRGHRYRFRLINACGLTCPAQLTIEGHNLTVIASDGEPLVPFNVTSITSFSAERYDFVINANQEVGSYWIQVRGTGQCVALKTQQMAILRYKSADAQPTREKPTYDTALDAGVILNELNIRCNATARPSNVCFSQLKNGRRVPRKILKKKPDIQLYLSFGFRDYESADVFKPGTYQRFIVVENETVGYMDNITNILPPSPLLSQPKDIPEEQICSAKKIPSRCKGPAPCPCTHIEKFPLNAVVEVILVDESKVEDLSHPFHIHGYVFYIVGEGDGNFYGVKKMHASRVKKLDSRGKLRRDLKSPPAKDTYAVPNNGFTIIRFLTDNPGYWLFHCHFEFHLAAGMLTIFQVGKQSDMPPVPKGFPRCGNFLPSISDDNYDNNNG